MKKEEEHDGAGRGSGAVAAEAAVRVPLAVEVDERAGRLRVEPGPLAAAVQVFREAAEAAGWVEVE